MSDVESKLKELLRDLADEMPVETGMPAPLRRRVHHRRGLNALLTMTAVAGLAVGAVVGVSAGLRAARSGTVKPAESPTPATSTWPAIWPQATRADAEKAQACADAGDPDCTWQLDAQRVIQAFAKFELWGGEAFFNESLDLSDPDESGPLTLEIGQCRSPDGVNFPRGCTIATVVVERLLRHDHTGIWFVTSSTQGVSEAPQEALDAKSLVNKFMSFRVKDIPGAEDFLSREALASYQGHTDGLSLYSPPEGPHYASFAIIDVREADANSFEIDVRIDNESGEGVGGAVFETLFVGPGTNVNGDQLPFVIQGANRTSLTKSGG